MLILKTIGVFFGVALSLSAFVGLMWVARVALLWAASGDIIGAVTVFIGTPAAALAAAYFVSNWVRR